MTRWTAGVVAGWLALLAAAALGFVTSGVSGSAVAALAFALGVAVVAGLAWAVGASLGRPARTRLRPVAAGAVAVAGWSVAAATVLEPAVPAWAFLGGVSLVGVLLGRVAADSPAGGLWHGTLAGGTGGVLTVYLAVYESFTMRPELDAVVVIAGVVAPLAFAVACGVGGAIGSVTLDAIGKEQVSK